MMLFILTVAAIGLIMLAMAVGVIVKNRCLRGSCGGPQLFGSDGEALGCETCPRRHENPDCERREAAAREA